MDSRLMKAGVAMAVGMTLMIPTFNAINNSYLEVTEVPPWLPTPTNIPDNLKPPSKLPENIPEGWQPPPDWNPPPEWKDWKPPEDWEGKAEGFPPPPGSCPPPVIKVVEPPTSNFTLDDVEFQFEAPQYTAGIGVWLNSSNWRASEVRAGVNPPARMDFGGEEAEQEQTSTLSTSSTYPRIAWEWIWDPRERNNELPEEGVYAIYIKADPPQSTPVLGNSQISGDVSLMVQIALPCGGAWQ